MYFILKQQILTKYCVLARSNRIFVPTKIISIILPINTKFGANVRSFNIYAYTYKIIYSSVERWGQPILKFVEQVSVLIYFGNICLFTRRTLIVPLIYVESNIITPNRT